MPISPSSFSARRRAVSAVQGEPWRPIVGQRCAPPILVFSRYVFALYRECERGAEAAARLTEAARTARSPSAAAKLGNLADQFASGAERYRRLLFYLVKRHRALDHSTRYYICWSNALTRTLARLGTKPAASRPKTYTDFAGVFAARKAAEAEADGVE